MLSDNFPDSLGKTYKLAHIMFKPSLLPEVHNLTKLHSKIPCLTTSELSVLYLWVQASKIVNDCLTTAICVIQSKKKNLAFRVTSSSCFALVEVKRRMHALYGCCGLWEHVISISANNFYILHGAEVKEVRGTVYFMVELFRIGQL